MPFLPPNQQRQSTKGNNINLNKTIFSNKCNRFGFLFQKLKLVQQICEKNCGFGGKSTKIGTDNAEYT